MGIIYSKEDNSLNINSDKIKVERECLINEKLDVVENKKNREVLIKRLLELF